MPQAGLVNSMDGQLPNNSRMSCWLAAGLLLMWWSAPAQAEGEATHPETLPEKLTLDVAVGWALAHNPELAVIREQHGIAAAGVVIAKTYPFNPFWEGKILPDFGPESSGVTNAVSQEHKLLLEVELHHQRRYRREGAAAALSRTDWEIAFQELTMAVRVIRAFELSLYRQEKLHFVEETIRLNEEAAKQVGKLVEQAQLRAGDLIVARTEVEDTRAQLGTARTALAVARNSMRRLLGDVGAIGRLEGTLEQPVIVAGSKELIADALDRRPDLRARTAAVTEAEARLRLTRADRCGNPVIGPMYDLNETRVNFVGTQITLPLPVFNRRKGEIMQREAELARASQELRQTEIQIQQEVDAALDRIKETQAWVDGYRTRTLPDMRKALEEMHRLFTQNQPGSDVLRVIDIRRKVLKAQSDYLDALWELSDAKADLAAAVGDPSVAFGPAPVAAPAGEDAKR
jgi:cobalt-zinc-cadmium efflux system outer membrane protein